LVDGTGFKLADIDFNMKATCFNEVKSNPRNPGNALVRFEFMEILVRIASDKYFKTGVCLTQADAVEHLLIEMVPFMETVNSETFRWEKYICEDVDLTLKSYLPILKSVFA
jgi:hypothetical protein